MSMPVRVRSDLPTIKVSVCIESYADLLLSLSGVVVLDDNKNHDTGRFTHGPLSLYSVSIGPYYWSHGTRRNDLGCHSINTTKYVLEVIYLPTCAICGKDLKVINSNHTMKHGLTLQQYIEAHGDPNVKIGGGRKTADPKKVKEKLTSEKKTMTRHQERTLDDIYALSETLVVDKKYTMVTSQEVLNHIVALFLLHKSGALDLETTGLDFLNDQIVGVVLTPDSPNPNDNYYIPIRHTDKEGKYIEGQLDPMVVKSALRNIFAIPELKLSFHNGIFDLLFLDSFGIKMDRFRMREVFYWDTLSAMHILNENLNSFKLKDLYGLYAKEPSDRYEDLFGKIKFNMVPLNVATQYAGGDGYKTKWMKDFQKPNIDSISNIKNVLYNIEMPLLPILFDMKKTGIAVDYSLAMRLKEDFQEKRDEHLQAVFAETGEINLNSPKQVAEAFFDRLKMPMGTASAKEPRSTKAAVMEALADLGYEVAEHLLAYKGYEKIIGTYLEPLHTYINSKTNKVHCSFSPTGARTGRFSSSNPNLQNIPARKKEFKQVRQVFVADPGQVLISADWSQVEPRLLAHVSGDPGLISIYQNDLDLYTSMASQIFRVPESECGDGSEYRKRMKTLVLAIMYDMTIKGLAARLKCSTNEAQDIIEGFNHNFSGVPATIKALKLFCRQNGYVETMYGRKRRIPDIWSEEKWIRAKAERTVLNSVIQGSAADLMKMAMIEVGYDRRLIDLGAKLLLTVHDELIVSAPRETAIESARIVVEDMTSIANLKVPLKCDCDIFTDGHWDSPNKISLKDINSGGLDPAQINWMV